MSIKVAIVPGDRVVPWINQCAPEWQLKPLKYLVNINSKILSEQTPLDFEIDYIDINSVDSGGHQNSVETMTFGNSPSRARRIVNGGDVIVSTVRTYLKAISYIEKANDNLICSTGFAVITSGKEVHPKFLFYWVRSEWFVNEIVARSIGVSYPAINAIEIGNLPFPAIPVEEQQAIADFLDQETTRIDELIARNQRLIELLQEQRTALITRIVTKGLNPDVPMKDSGVEWLGEIPAHWEVKRLKYVADVEMGQSPSSEDYTYDNQGIPFLQGNANFTELYPQPIVWCNTANKTAALGDILLSVRAPIGAVNIADQGYGIGRGLCAISGLKIYQKYLYFTTLCLDKELNSLGTGSTYAAVSVDQVKNVVMPVPSNKEQEAIADYIDREAARIDTLIIRINQAIEKLQECRSALITAAVTGKIDVRQQVS